MHEEERQKSNKQTMKYADRTKGSASAIYFLGSIGALVYYLHVHSGTVGLVVLAILKALVWPALLVYQLLQFLHM